MEEKSGERVQSKKMIELSYVIPTYNRAEYLGECLLSLEEQKYPKENYEVIVVDDGSDDTTPELMEYLMKDFKNISYYKLEHKGVEGARNFGNKKAKADIIGVCDSDDLYHEDRTKITINYFKKHPNVDITNGAYWEINHMGYPLKYYNAIALDRVKFLAGGNAYFCHDNCAYKKDKILKTPYRKKGGGTDDWKLIHDWLKAGYKFGFIDKELCKVRTLANGIMGQRREAVGRRLPYV